MSVFEIAARSAHEEGELGAVVGERKGHGFWCSNDAENLWHVSDLDPENLTVRRAVGLEQELRRINLRNTRPIYTLWDVIPK